MSNFTATVYGQDNKKPIFVFPDKDRSSVPSLFLGSLLQSYGFKAIVYRYNSSLFDEDIEKTARNVEEIKTDILKRIFTLGKRERKQIAVFGTGFGNLFSFLVANESPFIKKVIANVPFSNLREVVGQEKNKGQKKRQRLDDLLFDLNPENNTDRLSNKNFLCYLSKKDQIIPYQLQQKMVKKLEDEDASVQLVINTKHNHTISSVINVLKTDTYLRFLHSD